MTMPLEHAVILLATFTLMIGAVLVYVGYRLTELEAVIEHLLAMEVES